MKIFWLGIIMSGIVSLFVIDGCLATSTPVVMTHIRPSGPGGALHESIILLNTSENPVDISGWCLRNKAGARFFCFTPESHARIYLAPQGNAVIVSSQLRSTLSHEAQLWVYVPTHASSGSLTASSGDISLLDDAGEIVDRYIWTTALLTGQSLMRMFLEEGDSAWVASMDQSLPMDATWQELGEATEDEEEIVAPEDEVLILPSLIPVQLSEVFPNPKGSDVGAEFIELYNPNDFDVDIGNHVLEIGITTTKRITVKTSTTIPAHSYVILTNADYSYSLNNSAGGVRLFEPGGKILIDETVYQDPLEGSTWALIEGEWQYTATPTPSAQNIREDHTYEEDIPATTKQKSCQEGQYRHPETNRCRKIVEPAKPAACKVGQERNPETNRCRNIVAASVPAPCKAGQERSPETNRCRNVVTMSQAAHKVLGVTDKQSQVADWYVWAATGLAGASIIGYAVWEWRVEVRRAFEWVKHRLTSR